MLSADAPAAALDERCFQAIAESASDMIAVLDAAGRRLYANPAFERLLSRADFISGSDSFGHVHPLDRSRVRKLFMRVLTDRQGRRARYRIIDRRGAVRQACRGIEPSRRGSPRSGIRGGAWYRGPSLGPPVRSKCLRRRDEGP